MKITQLPCLMRFNVLGLTICASLMLSACFPVAIVGAGAGALFVSDRRLSETYIADQAVETRVSHRINEKFPDAHINVTSYNLKVLLTGEAATAQARSDMESLAAAVPNVKAVVNEISIAAPSSFAARSNDTYLTSKIKARFVDSNLFSATNVKVVTEASVAYLLGIVSQREADAAVEIARTTSGVQKVVRVFEILSEEKIRSLSPLPAKKEDKKAPNVNPPGGSDPITG